MFVASIQMEPIIGDKRTNVSRSIGFIEIAVERGAEFGRAA